MTTPRLGVRIGALVLAALAAPTASWLLFVAGAIIPVVAEGGMVAENLIGALVFTVLITAWGFLPALIFGGVAMVVAQRLGGGLWLRVLGGLVASAAYIGAGCLLHAAFQSGAFLIAPWTGLVFGTELDIAANAEPWGVLAAIFASGGVGGLVYHAVARGG